MSESTLIPGVAAAVLKEDFQFASESIATSSVSGVLLFKIAHIYWSISKDSIRADLLLKKNQLKTRQIWKISQKLTCKQDISNYPSPN